MRKTLVCTYIVGVWWFYDSFGIGLLEMFPVMKYKLSQPWDFDMILAWVTILGLSLQLIAAVVIFLRRYWARDLVFVTCGVVIVAQGAGLLRLLWMQGLLNDMNAPIGVQWGPPFLRLIYTVIILVYFLSEPVHDYYRSLEAQADL